MKKLLTFLFVLGLLLISFSSQNSHADPICSVGDKAEVLWGNRWWKASVIDVNIGGTSCKIHYAGYGSSWDEWVGEDRIRIPSKQNSQVYLHKSNYKTFNVGDPVQVLWGGKWWPAHVLQVSGDQLKINYDGYNHSWDEWVGPNRYRAR